MAALMELLQPFKYAYPLGGKKQNEYLEVLQAKRAAHVAHIFDTPLLVSITFIFCHLSKLPFFWSSTN